MLTQRWITKAQRATAQFPATVAPKPPTNGIPGNYLGHIYTQVNAELATIGINEQDLNSQGLTITTTIDPALEKQAADISNAVLRAQPKNLRTALVAEAPRTGAILAYYGGNDGVGLDYAQVLKQPGSTFKPFVMTAALQQHPPIGIGTEYNGTSPQTFGALTVSTPPVTAASVATWSRR
jgi:membrane peptidoglycan carboxypeptidase